MPKTYKDLEEIKRAYEKALINFQNFQKDLDSNRNMRLVLLEDANSLKASFLKFKNVLEQWDVNQDLQSVGVDSFVDSLNHSLNQIIQEHKNLATRANNIKEPSIVQKVKDYLSSAVTYITTLCAAVKDFVTGLSKKTTNAISTSFNSFKESIKNIKTTKVVGSAVKNNQPGPGPDF